MPRKSRKEEKKNRFSWPWALAFSVRNHHHLFFCRAVPNMKYQKSRHFSSMVSTFFFWFCCFAAKQKKRKKEENKDNSSSFLFHSELSFDAYIRAALVQNCKGHFRMVQSVVVLYARKHWRPLFVIQGAARQGWWWPWRPCPKKGQASGLVAVAWWVLCKERKICKVSGLYSRKLPEKSTHI